MNIKRITALCLAALLLLLCPFAPAEEEGDLLMLVGPEDPVPDGWVPRELVRLEEVIPEGFCTYEHEGILAVPEAAEAWVRLLEAAHADGLTEWCFSEGYRSVEEQRQLLDDTVSRFMSERGLSGERALEAALITVALPGCSEHHTGLAFDITVPGEYFGDTAQYLWMLTHAAEYGFILRYPEEKEDLTGYELEEWHFRYVGTEHAMKISAQGLCLEEYLAE